jgi:DNA end-binding protein Ku
MPRGIWTGTVSFGLVSIPVKLYNATSPKDVRFHQFDRETGRRVRYRRVTEEMERPADAEVDLNRVSRSGETSREEPVVSYENVVKGYEVDRDRFVLVSPEELEALRPEQSRTIEIEAFVNLEDIDPVFFEKSYYLAPVRGLGAEKPYGLLLGAMERAHKVGVASFVLRSKEYLAAIRPVRGMLGLETMFFDDEVRTADEIENVPVSVQPSSRELDVAVRLIDLLATDWDPARYQDTYRQRVLQLIEGKVEAEGIHVPEPAPRPAAGIPDLMAALKASVEAAKKDAASESPPKRRGGPRRRTG